MPGLTSPQNYPYPLYTEANNGPAQIQALADAIDNGIVASQALIASIVSRKAFRVSSGVAQSIPNNTNTLAVFATEEFDNDTMFNVGVSTTNATVNTAGLFLFTMTSTWAANATGVRMTALLKNGVQVGAFQAVSAGGVLSSGTPFTMLINAIVGDVFTVRLFQTSGGALNSTSRVFSASRVSG